MSYKIVGDSCMDCTEELKKKITLVPLTLEVDDHRVIDDETFDQKAFLELVKNSKNGAKTACPSPQAFMEAYEGKEERVYCITLSQHLSGCYNDASIGKDMFYEEHEGSTKKIAVFSSDSACSGETLIALKIMELEEKGLSFEEICEILKDFIWNIDTFFVLESLDTLKKNGRLKGLAAVIATTLNIKPFMGEDHGVIIKLDQARGINKALKKLIDHVASHVKDPEDKVLAITHCNCLERGEFVRDEILKRVTFKDVLMVDAAGVATTYACDGGIVVSY